MWLYIYIYMCVCMHVCMYVCMYVCECVMLLIVTVTLRHTTRILLAASNVSHTRSPGFYPTPSDLEDKEDEKRGARGVGRSCIDDLGLAFFLLFILHVYVFTAESSLLYSNAFLLVCIFSPDSHMPLK